MGTRQSRKWEWCFVVLAVLMMAVWSGCDCGSSGPGTEKLLEKSNEKGGKVEVTQPDESASVELVKEDLVDAAPEKAEEVVPELPLEVPPEPQAPIVLSSTPKDGEEVEQPTGKPIIITVNFDMEMDTSTLSDQAITIQPAVPGLVTPRKDGKSMEFVPQSDLPLFTKFTVTISTSVKGKNGLNMAKEHVFSFTTKAEGTEPSFLSTFSSAGGTSKSSMSTHHWVHGQSSVVGEQKASSGATHHSGFIYTFTF